MLNYQRVKVVHWFPQEGIHINQYYVRNFAAQKAALLRAQLSAIVTEQQPQSVYCTACLDCVSPCFMYN